MQTQIPGEVFPTTDEDLAGFWDMVMLQVVQVNDIFDHLEKLRNSQWQEVRSRSPVTAPAPVPVPPHHIQSSHQIHDLKLPPSAQKPVQLISKPIRKPTRPTFRPQSGIPRAINTIKHGKIITKHDKVFEKSVKKSQDIKKISFDNKKSEINSEKSFLSEEIVNSIILSESDELNQVKKINIINNNKAKVSKNKYKSTPSLKLTRDSLLKLKQTSKMCNKKVIGQEVKKITTNSMIKKVSDTAIKKEDNKRIRESFVGMKRMLEDKSLLSSEEASNYPLRASIEENKSLFDDDQCLFWSQSDSKPFIPFSKEIIDSIKFVGRERITTFEKNTAEKNTLDSKLDRMKRYDQQRKESLFRRKKSSIRTQNESRGLGNISSNVVSNEREKLTGRKIKRVFAVEYLIYSRPFHPNHLHHKNKNDKIYLIDIWEIINQYKKLQYLVTNSNNLIYKKYQVCSNDPGNKCKFNLLSKQLNKFILNLFIKFFNQCYKFKNSIFIVRIIGNNYLIINSLLNYFKIKKKISLLKPKKIYCQLSLYLYIYIVLSFISIILKFISWIFFI